SHHPGYTPLSKVDDEMVLKVGRDDAQRSSVAFANLVDEDQSAKSLSSKDS
ncbi:MAG TPA: phytanoyl-CoA dioxygenase family protein, partial [Verrucomicrobiales bacterium]|nr:phytanoyl-CoA dioxygenase family protein [Verrucomicrobiales bacterium]